MAAKGYRMNKQEKLLQLIDCPICLCELQDPRLLSCSHVMCYKCLVEYHDKGSYGSNLPCSECRQVTPLYKGGVDNLPPFFFMKNLKEVIMEKDDAIASKPQPQGGVVCSTESCGQPGVKYWDVSLCVSDVMMITRVSESLNPTKSFQPVTVSH